MDENNQSKHIREERTTLTLSITAKDKRALKMRAAKEGKTVAGVIHRWIQNWETQYEGC